MDNLLRQFNSDYNTKVALLSFIREFIDKEALDKMYKKEDVSHIADANKLIIDAFEHLETLYGIKQQPKETTNQSR